jgi:MFS family permease
MRELIRPVRNPVYRRLFSAQVIALVGTGLATVALALLAFDLAGDDAGIVLGFALALKMVAYVLVSPVVAALARNTSRRRLLIGFDLGRAGLVLLIPLVDSVWQVFVLVFLLNACSAGFTPTFQAAIPDVLPDSDTYTEALSLSRLAYELEALLSPVLAAALLGLVSYNALFSLNGVAFLISAFIVARTVIPQPAAIPDAKRLLVRTFDGIRRFLATPRLRGLFWLNFVVASAGAMVIVNTVVYVKESFGLSDAAVGWGLASAGAGSIAAAVLLPALLRRLPDRSVMLAGGALLSAGLAAGVMISAYPAMLACWFVLGVGLSAVQTPVGRLVRRSARSEGRPALFAAQFSLSHLFWLVTYPLAGLAGQALGLGLTSGLLAATAATGVLFAAISWPAEPRGPAGQDTPGEGTGIQRTPAPGPISGP